MSCGDFTTWLLDCGMISGLLLLSASWGFSKLGI